MFTLVKSSPGLPHARAAQRRNRRDAPSFAGLSEGQQLPRADRVACRGGGIQVPRSTPALRLLSAAAEEELCAGRVLTTQVPYRAQHAVLRGSAISLEVDSPPHAPMDSPPPLVVSPIPLPSHISSPSLSLVTEITSQRASQIKLKGVFHALMRELLSPPPAPPRPPGTLSVFLWKNLEQLQHFYLSRTVLLISPASAGRGLW